MYLWIALGLVVLGVLGLGGLAFDLYGHVKRLRDTARLAQLNLEPKLRQLQPLMSIQRPQLRPAGRLTGDAQQSDEVRTPKHSVESKSRHLEERT